MKTTYSFPQHTFYTPISMRALGMKNMAFLAPEVYEIFEKLPTIKRGNQEALFGVSHLAWKDFRIVIERMFPVESSTGKVVGLIYDGEGKPTWLIQPKTN